MCLDVSDRCHSQAEQPTHLARAPKYVVWKAVACTVARATPDTTCVNDNTVSAVGDGEGDGLGGDGAGTVVGVGTPVGAEIIAPA